MYNFLANKIKYGMVLLFLALFLVSCATQKSQMKGKMAHEYRNEIKRVVMEGMDGTLEEVNIQY